jgi:hypothetical protein
MALRIQAHMGSDGNMMRSKFGVADDRQDGHQLGAGWIDVQAAHAGEAGKLLIGVVPLMLHARRERHHGQVVGVHDIVDIAGQPHGELGVSSFPVVNMSLRPLYRIGINMS